MKKSPIFYMGNKERLVKKGLIDLFPQNIYTFYDVFCGSGIVALNSNAMYYELNDLDINTIDLIQMFCYYENEPLRLIVDVNNVIEKYNLPKFSTDTRKFKGDREIYKNNFNKLREDYNNTKDVLLLYVLNIFSNSHMLRFNSDNKFNMPFGNGYFTEETQKRILDNIYYKVTYLSHKDFREYYNTKYEENDFVYLDPPYIGTTATYNENGGWTDKDDKDLMKFCEFLNDIGVKFAMSNVFYNKGIENSKLIEWTIKNNFKVHKFNNFTYCACGKGNSNTLEVLIMNY